MISILNVTFAFLTELIKLEGDDKVCFLHKGLRKLSFLRTGPESSSASCFPSAFPEKNGGGDLISRSLWSAVLAFALLTAGCTREPKPTIGGIDRGDNFSDQEAETLHGKEQFRIEISPKTKDAPSPADKKAPSVVEWVDSDTLTEKDLLGKAIKIKTALSGKEVKNSISQAGTVIDPKSKVSFINQYQLLDYKFLDPKPPLPDSLDSARKDPQKLLAFLLGKLDRFKGFPDTTYYILPRLDSNYLILYRLGLPDTIPYDELPLARKVGDFLATPLVGYPIQYCVPEKKENQYGEKTDQSRAKCEGISPENAKYVQFNLDKKQEFTYKPKWDLFPRDFFNGEWFFVRTVVRTSEGRSDQIGGRFFTPAHLVEFVKTSNSLQVKDASGYDMKEGDRVKSYSIPVVWKDYEIDRDSGRIRNFQEKEKDYTMDVERPYFTIDFEELKWQEGGALKAETILKRMVVTDTYFSFDIESVKANQTPEVVAFTFLKSFKNLDYREKQWFEADSTGFFPVFFDVRKYYKTSIIHTEEDEEKFYRVTRFDPDQEEIRWHFSNITPKNTDEEWGWVRDIGRRIIKLENRAFELAGEGSGKQIKIVLDESEDKDLGDTRYNIINFIVTESQTSSGLLGYGPSVSHPVTGEVVSATANIWVSNIVDIYVKLIRQYIRFNVYPPVWKLANVSTGVTDFLHEKIQKLCPSAEKFIQEKKGDLFHPVKTILKDHEIIKNCSRKMAQNQILSTGLHEIRHGLGFRHVFSASKDKENFYKSYDEIKELFGEDILTDDAVKSHPGPAQFSSVMDYPHFQFPALAVPGHYDVSATRWLYYDRVDLVEKGQFLDLSSKDAHFKNIETMAKDQGISEEKIKHYQVCGGENPEGGQNSEFTGNDPLCNVYDYGSSPKDVAENIVGLIKDSLMSDLRRYDSESMDFEKSQVSKYSQALSSLLEKWQSLRDPFLETSYQKVVFDWFDDNDAVEYRNIMTAKRAGENEGSEFLKYYEVRQPIYDFFTELYFLPLQQCVFMRADGSYRPVAMEVIKKRIQDHYPTDSRALFRNCQSDPVKKWADETGQGAFVTEVGLPLKAGSYFLRPTEEDKLDEVSIFNFLTNDYGGSQDSVWDSTIDSLIKVTDESDLLSDFRQKITDYFVNGQDLNPYISAETRRELELPVLNQVLSYEADTEIIGDVIMTMPPKLVTSSMLKHRMIYFLYTSTTRFKNSQISTDTKKKINLSRFRAMPLNQFQLGITQLTQNPDTANSQMAIAYESEVPFIYSAWTKYSNKYDHPEKQKERPFIQFFLEQPNIYLTHHGKSQFIAFPISTDKGGLFSKMLNSLNEHKSCIENDTSSSPCEDREAKQAYIDWFNRTFLISD